MATKVGDWYHYSGAVHIHTSESDGTKPLEEVVALGCEVGLDFMMFSDHMGLTNRDAGLEGIYGETLVVIGYEHNDHEDKNHYLIFDSPGVYPSRLYAREYVAAARADGALGIIAHPIEKRSRSGKYPPYPWTEWNTDDYDGLELWNQMSEWMERLTPYNKLAMAFSPRKSMIGPHPEALQLWDRVSRQRKCVGLAGVDAHAFPVSVGLFTVEIFPYKVHFRSLRTHVLLAEPMSNDFKTARDQLYEALRECRVYFSNTRWGSADGFDFRATQDGCSVVCGGSLDSHEGAMITVELPARATIIVMCDGEEVHRVASRQLKFAVEKPGLYRVEVWRGKRGWIFSNHVRIGI
ncbi:MAG: histidinol-phosphatase [Candidatus Zixiibacteriota bacterium]|nr:MAG: histidinol-phosphatase [candidate division Zixibacteria bacterium]